MTRLASLLLFIAPAATLASNADKSTTVHDARSAFEVLKFDRLEGREAVVGAPLLDAARRPSRPASASPLALASFTAG